jgi:hypothetical protein
MEKCMDEHTKCHLGLINVAAVAALMAGKVRSISKCNYSFHSSIT